MESFSSERPWTARAARYVVSLLKEHPFHALVAELEQLVRAELEDTALWQNTALMELHQGLEDPSALTARAQLWLALCMPEEPLDVQAQLEALRALQAERDKLVHQQLLFALGRTARRALASSAKSRTSRITSILATLDRLESAATWERAQGALQTLQALLLDTFPIWLCRKQAVSFLLPCEAQCVDFVIVDEATQCRVDDALPLLFRAEKLLAVGDERQTGLCKSSPIDDYLFEDLELDEHLQFSQARGIKGGGSHLFGLVGRIKRASVMLDEHYRCPPDVIEFSNRYVYEGALRTMQWRMQGAGPSVVINHSEMSAPPCERATSGRFRGIETQMIDRFFAYVARTLKRLEQQTGERIDPEQDVALVYFLLKNEPYIRAKKGELLRRLPRGSDVLDGAGAALQGKERKYIFYLWDITRYNISSFRQGDDETKRKGELNVLMSRPKRMAFHYLHRDFEELKHHSCNIADYLWRTKRGEGERSRATQGAGALLKALLGRAGLELEEQAQLDVTLGDPRYGVDLMWLPRLEIRQRAPSIGLVNLSKFASAQRPGQAVVDYFFQLRRARPGIEPVFGFVHQLCQPSAREKLTAMDDARAFDRPE